MPQPRRKQVPAIVDHEEATVTAGGEPPRARGFGIKTLLWLTVNVSLFCAGLVWTLRGPEADGVADQLRQAAEEAGAEILAFGLIVTSPFLLAAGLIVVPATMIRVGRYPYGVLHVLAFLLASLAVVLVGAVGWDEDQVPAKLQRLAIPLAIAAIAANFEVVVRRLPTPCWAVAGISLLLAACYTVLVVAVE